MAMRVRKPNGETIEVDVDSAPAPARTAVAEPETGYPVPYYNPRCIDERFAMEGQTYRLRFANGRFIATNDQEEMAVRNALAIYGRDKADRWRGDDRKTEWVCKKCGFRTRNDNAKDDHEGRH